MLCYSAHGYTVQAMLKIISIINMATSTYGEISDTGCTEPLYAHMAKIRDIRLFYAHKANMANRGICYYRRIKAIIGLVSRCTAGHVMNTVMYSRLAIIEYRHIQ